MTITERQLADAARVIEEGRQRALNEDHSLLTLRTRSTHHVVHVLSGDHRAYLQAIGHRDVGVQIALIEAPTPGTTRRPDWRHANNFVTDRSTIAVKVPAPDLRTPLREFVAKVRGVLHHDTGHLRFTIPLAELWERGAHVLDGTPDALFSPNRLHVAWGCLEDQRMEAAVVTATPRIGSYFVPMVLDYVLAASDHVTGLPADHRRLIDQMAPWLALAGRSYMPASVRAWARDEFDTVALGLGVDAAQWFEIVSRYLSAVDEGDMLRAVADAYHFIERITRASTGPDSTHFAEALADRITNPSEDHQTLHESSDTDPAEAATTTVEPDYSETPRPDSFDLAQVRDKAMQLLMASADIDDVMQRIGERIGHSNLTPRTPVESRPMLAHEEAAAQRLSVAMADALEEFRTARSPTWVRHQEEGYLDPLAYRTRNPGEPTFRRSPQMWDAQGFGLHVSFLADRSDSMTNAMLPLSQTMWATQSACDTLGIPNTMVLWSDSAVTVRDEIPVCYRPSGGSQPAGALNDLDCHVTDGGLHHLVIIFTDGEWFGVSELTAWSRPGRSFVVIGLNCEETIADKGADAIIPITSITHLGHVVKLVLADNVAMLTAS